MYAHRNTSRVNLLYIILLVYARDHDIKSAHVSTMAGQFQTLRSKIDDAAVIESVEAYDIRRVFVSRAMLLHKISYKSQSQGADPERGSKCSSGSL